MATPTKPPETPVSVPATAIHLPVGGIAVFGRSGSGKSSMFFKSKYLKKIVISDMGSLSHKLYARCGDENIHVIDWSLPKSPILQVLEYVDHCIATQTIGLFDSWTTLQESQVAWSKKQRNGVVSIRDHQAIVGNFRDLALKLSQAPMFTIFNTSPGGKGKTPEGQEIIYPAGCITGYPSLNGTGPNSETILARWSTVWGVFGGHGETPRGLFVPQKDIRPESFQTFAPLKDPCMVVTDTSGKGIMKFPDMTGDDVPCFVDTLLEKMAQKFPKRSKP